MEDEVDEEEIHRQEMNKGMGEDGRFDALSAGPSRHGTTHHDSSDSEVEVRDNGKGKG